jgi:hypothetical protein
MEDIALNLSLDEIVKELDDKNLLYMTSGKIKELKNNILQKLYLDRDELLHYHKVLKEYIYIDELDEVKLGSYIRWFNIRKMENLKLTNGGIVVDFKQGNEDIIIVCKNPQGRFFSLQLNKNIIFKKMSTQEKLLIKIIDYIHK